MTEPVFFTVAADYRSVIADAASDPDYNPQLGSVTATVTFTPLLASGDVILATDASPRPTGFVPAPIVGRIDTDGQLKLRVDPDDGGGGTFTPIRLLADTPLLELDGPLYYAVSFTNVAYNGRPGRIAGFNFQAPSSDTTINLIEVGRAAGETGQGITKAVVSVGSTITLDTGEPATVINSGSPVAAVLDFGLPRGAQGIQGIQGDIGPRGDAATIQIGTVTSSASGGAGSVVNAGSSGEAVLDFVLPRGDTGPQGPQGADGEAIVTGIGDVTNLGRRVATTSGVGATESGYWTKLLTFPTSGSFGWSNKIFAVVAGTQYATSSAILQFACTNQSSGTAATLRYLSAAGGAYLHVDGFKVTRGAHGEPIELWMRAKANYLSFIVHEIAGSGGGGSSSVWLSSQGWQAAEPVGSGFNVVAEPPAFFGAPLVTTSAVQTLTNKTIDGVANTITDLPASATPQAARLVCRTAGGGTTTENGANTWAKIATINVSNFLLDTVVLLGFTFSGYNTSSATRVCDTGIISATVKPWIAGDPVRLQLNFLAKPEDGRYVREDSFKLVATGLSSATSNVVELWVKKYATYGSGAFTEISVNSFSPPDRVITYHDGAAWQSAEPTGVTELRSNGVQVFGKPVVTGTAQNSGTALIGPLVNNPSSTGWVPGLHNDLASLVQRGGTMTTTKNGVDFGDHSYLFTGNTWFNRGAVAEDVFVFEIGYPTVDMGPNDGSVIGVHLYAPVPNVKIEIFRGAAWWTVYEVVGDGSSSHIHWVRPPAFAGTSKFRVTLSGTTLVRIKEFFSVLDQGYGITARAGLGSSVMFRNGGNLYGSTAAPVTLSAAGVDSSIDFRLNSKGSGQVTANGIPVVTTTAAQTLSNKTLTSPTINAATVDSLDNLSVTSESRLNKSYDLNFYKCRVVGFGPWPRAWHDVFRWNWVTNGAEPLFERFNGSSWYSATGLNGLFDGRNGTSFDVFGGAPNTGARWTWSGGYLWGAALGYIAVALTYAGGTVNTSFLVERSDDGVAWTTVHWSSGSTNQGGYELLSLPIGYQPHLRLTITSNNPNGIRVSAIEGLTLRTGNQGGGTENEYPYTWDSSGNISSRGTLSQSGVPVVTTTGAQTLTNKTLTSPTINTPRIDSIKDTNGNSIVGLAPVANAVNHFTIANAAAGSIPSISATGTMRFSAGSSGYCEVRNGNGVIFRAKADQASTVNNLSFLASASGTDVEIRGEGSDTDVGVTIRPQGAGILRVGANPVGVKVAVPATATSTGVPGQWAADANWHYVCTATNTWRRTALSTW